jgi:hypothetical protein
MTPQAKPSLHDASKTINDFFLHHIPPLEIRTPWAQLRIHFLTSSAPQISTPTTAPISDALDKIQECLMLIEKCVSAPQSTAKPLLSYADAARMPPPPSKPAPEKFVPGTLLKEVTV